MVDQALCLLGPGRSVYAELDFMIYPRGAPAAMARQGRYQDVTANLRVKEVKISDTERFVVCHNPDAAARDAEVRANFVDRLDA